MLQLNFSPFPELTTARTKLRKILVTDADNMLLLRSDIDAMRYIDRPLPDSINDIYEILAKIENGIQQNDTIGWGITLKDDPQLIGSIGYHRIEKENDRAEIGYMLHPAAWQKGYMSETIKKVIDFGFNEMKLHSIEAKINPSNLASAQLLKKHNFRKEAYYKENHFFNGKFLDTEVYSLLRPLI